MEQQVRGEKKEEEESDFRSWALWGGQAPGCLRPATWEEKRL